MVGFSTKPSEDTVHKYSNLKLLEVKPLLLEDEKEENVEK